MTNKSIIETLAELLVDSLSKKCYFFRDGQTCYHCEGKKEIEYVDYQASGAEISKTTCGICKGKGTLGKEFWIKLFKEALEAK